MRIAQAIYNQVKASEIKLEVVVQKRNVTGAFVLELRDKRKALTKVEMLWLKPF